MILLIIGIHLQMKPNYYRIYRQALPAALPVIKSIDSPKKNKPKQESWLTQEQETQNEPFDDPKAIVREVKYDVSSEKFLITEKLNGRLVKPPYFLTFDEYMALLDQKENKAYLDEKYKTEQFSQREASGGDDKNSLKSKLNKKAKDKANEILSKNNLPTIFGSYKNPITNIFGEGPVDIKPNVQMGIRMGYNHNIVRNPLINPAQQSQGFIDFDMNLNLSLKAKIGSKFENVIQYNNQGGFNFEGQQIRLQYKGEEDEIIKNLEAGNVAFDLPTQLITGSQSLWGIKSELQFGKMFFKTVLSQERGQQKSKIIENGVEVQKFEINAQDYEANRHFFLSQFFRDQYESAVVNLPQLQSKIVVQQVEVWVSNRNNTTQGIRDAICFQDIGEHKPYAPSITPGQDVNPSNLSNSLYPAIANAESIRNTNENLNALQQSPYRLLPFVDFEKSFMRKLNSNEFTFDPQLGYVSILSSVQPNDIVAVAYQYQYNGKTYQVGDMSRDVVTPDSTSNSPSRSLFLKLLKGTNLNPAFPVFDLMMKNVYNLNAFQISNKNFAFNILYNDPGQGIKMYLPEGNLSKKPLLQVLNLDRLNQNNDPYPDGLFDFVEKYTVLPQTARVIFPVLEPFGSFLKSQLDQAGNANLSRKYVFQELYDSTQFVAQNLFPNKARFIFRGTYQGGNQKKIQLGPFVTPGSVKVFMNGIALQEGKDFTLDAGGGSLELADHVINSGGKIQIDYNDRTIFSMMNKNFVGLRAEYRHSPNFRIGATYQSYSEIPLNNKLTYNEDPVSNQMLGADIQFDAQTPWITSILDKLPFYETKERSNVKFYGEFAHLIPGHVKIPFAESNVVYIDDFEAISLGYDFGFPANVWRLSATPKDARDKFGRVLFPEADLFDDFRYGYNRAKLSWYSIANNLMFEGQRPAYITDAMTRDLYQRVYFIRDIFPNRSNQNVSAIQNTLNLAFYPNQKGPYNFERSESPTSGISLGINRNNTLKAPQTRWGGMQKSINNTNFETNNIEYVQFWILDPFIKSNNLSVKGDMYINLGYINEDILRDGKMNYENGLFDRALTQSNLMHRSIWGWAPLATPLNNNFENDAVLRKLQDVGYDGLSDEEEQVAFSKYLEDIKPFLDPEAYAKVASDPSTDNFKFFLDPELIRQELPIAGLYKDFNGVENNTPLATSTASIVPSNYTFADNEDLNRDNTLNEEESYYQYRVELYKGMDVSNHPYIISKVKSTNAVDAEGDTAVWYQVRIPIRKFDHRVGNISDFRNIQFVRMFLTNFEDSVVIRMTETEFLRTQWLTYQSDLTEPSDFIPRDNSDETLFQVSGVNLEENFNKTPVNYVTPNGIAREVGVNATGNAISLNEQAMKLQFKNLTDGATKASYRNFSYDLRQYENLKVFFHLEDDPDTKFPMKDKEISVFMRIGNDFKENYYEYEIPLQITPPGIYSNRSTSDKSIVWPDSNQMVINLKELANTKIQRNREQFPLTIPFTILQGNKNITVKGNPDFGVVRTIMIGVRNRNKKDPKNFDPIIDDGQAKSGEVWVNELRLTGLNEEGGSAGLATMQVKLADLGNLNASANMHTIGFGQITQRVNQRSLNDFYQYSVNSNLQLGKLFPKKIGLQLPFFIQTNQSVSTPKYDPFNTDLLVSAQQKFIGEAFGSDSLWAYNRIIQVRENRFGFNFTNVRIIPEGAKKVYPWSIQNLSATYSFNVIDRSSPLVEKDIIKNYLGELNYSYATQPAYIEPFKNAFKNKKSKYFDIIRGIHINFLPSAVVINNRIERLYSEFDQRRQSFDAFQIPTLYNKNFIWNRSYNLTYSPIRPINITYSAHNFSRIDEPQGAIDNQEKRDSIWNSITSFGRTMQFKQNLNATYQIPLEKIPFLYFANANANYNSGFEWHTGARVRNQFGEIIQSPQGNNIKTNQSYGASLKLQLDKLYEKVPVFRNLQASGNSNFVKLTSEQKDKKVDDLKKQKEKHSDKIDKIRQELEKINEKIKNTKKIDSLSSKQKHEKIKELRQQRKKERQKIRELKKLKRDIVIPENSIIGDLAQPLLAIKDIQVDYNITNTSDIHGFTQRTQYIGIDYNQTNRLDESYVFGIQPGLPMFAPMDKYGFMRWLDEGASKNWFTRDSTFNMMSSIATSKNFRARMTIEPFRQLKINLNWESRYEQRYTQLFKFNQSKGIFEHQNPIESGSYTFSDINLLSYFEPGGQSNIDRLMRLTKAYGQIFKEINPSASNEFYFNPVDSIVMRDYFMGYGPLQTDVLVNSFLSTYRGTGASKANTSVFSSIPLPNWDLRFTGFMAIPFIKKNFMNFSLSHSYKSNTTVSEYNSNLFFEGNGLNNPVVLDTLSNNFISYFYIPKIMISESFNPLLGFEFKTKKNIGAGFQYRSSRQISLSLIDYFLIENLTSGITARFNFSVKNLNLPIKDRNGANIVLKNDLNFDFNFSYDNTEMINYRLNQFTYQIINGAERLNLKTDINYKVNNKVNLSLYYNHIINIPKTQASVPTENFSFGTNLRINLTD
ncbi:MAG: cell surface protein SprA [Chitinophagales bacterium]|nr:cell surface protein SprA [Chitinophagales bacterium]